MSFLSYPFLWLFLPFGLLLYWCVPGKARNFVLLTLNAVFYLYGGGWYFLLLCYSIALTYFGARAIDARRADTAAARRCLGLVLAANFCTLLPFKAVPFVTTAANMVLPRFGIAVPYVQTPVLPLGLSFYLFSGSGYLIDVYRQQIPVQTDFWRHASFVSFFPTISAGPILRAGPWYAQQKALPRLTWERFKQAVLIVLWGAFLKIVMADRIALYVNAVYADPDACHGYYLLAAVLLYSLQIYTDFAGYSTMALGIALAFGFDLPENFRQPYLEKDVAGFWRCWHVSLTSWFRDYIYIPLGGNRRGTLRRYGNIFIVFLVSGLWHGAGVVFLVWGALHAVYQIVGDLSQKRRLQLYRKCGIKTDTDAFYLGQAVCMYLLISFAWIFFRMGSLAEALAVLKGLLRLDNPWVLFDGSMANLSMGGSEQVILILALLVLLTVSVRQHRGWKGSSWVLQQGPLFQALVIGGALFVLLIFGIYGPGFLASNFIYAGF